MNKSIEKIDSIRKSTESQELSDLPEDIQRLFDPDMFDFSVDFAAKWMKEQEEALASLPEDPWNHWEPMDDDDPVLDYMPDPYNGKIVDDSMDLELDLNDFE